MGHRMEGTCAALCGVHVSGGARGTRVPALTQTRGVRALAPEWVSVSLQVLSPPAASSTEPVRDGEEWKTVLKGLAARQLALTPILKELREKEREVCFDRAPLLAGFARGPFLPPLAPAFEMTSALLGPFSD